MQEIDIKANFSRNIKDLRISRNLNQVQLGEKINYSSKAISKWENGDVLPDVVVLKMLADFFNVTIDDLISDKSIVKKSHKKVNRLLTTVVSSLTAYLAAAIVFFILVLCKIDKAWISFIYAIPTSTVIFLVFSSIWYSRKQIMISAIATVWASSLLIMFLMSFKIFWVVLIIAAILSILAVIFFSIRFNIKRKEE